MRRELDLVHSFGRLAALLPILPNRRLPKIQTYERQIAWRGIERARLLAGSSITFTACSDAMWRKHLKPWHGRWRTVYNGVNLDLYRATSSVPLDAPLVFLGRIERIKGVHSAIEIARRATRRLVIAGNVVDSDEGRRYFEQEVRPHLSFGDVTFLGPVDDEQKKQLLGTTAALLMPIEWEEPFGIVMIEAMANGTPVLGFRRGSVPEIVEDGLTGYVVEDIEGAVAALPRVAILDRMAVRARCGERFSSSVIVDAYERLYYETLGSSNQGLKRAG